MNQMRERASRENHTDVVYARQVELSNPFYVVKRMIDVLFAGALLAITSPILVLLMVLIRLESKGPAIYVQERVGYMGKSFYIYKLRSMVSDAEKNGPQWASRNDARVTRIGGFIRRTRLDELPQLINVLRGEMSLIGPRPEREPFVKQFNERIPGFYMRVYMKPGLTGLAQVNGGYELTPEEKFKMDIEYINHHNPKMETQIFFKTIMVVLTGSGAR